MATPALLQQAADRLELAQLKLAHFRESPSTPANTRRWLEALTDYALALGEVQAFAQESADERLQALERRVAPAEQGSRPAAH